MGHSAAGPTGADGNGYSAGDRRITNHNSFVTQFSARVGPARSGVGTRDHCLTAGVVNKGAGIGV